MSVPTTSPVIVALDVPSRDEALALVDRCRGRAGMFKVGNQLFTGGGPEVVRSIVERGERVFLDLKFHDIPNTVAQAAAESARLGASMITIHASGGPDMIRTTIEKLEAEWGSGRPMVVAVTVLTSMDASGLQAVGVHTAPRQQVLDLGRMAVGSGADGLVCSPEEVGSLRSELGPEATIVTPGVRMPGQSADDQKRIATPKQAVLDGANWIVVGRYVSRADDPARALGEVLDSLSP